MNFPFGLGGAHVCYSSSCAPAHAWCGVTLMDTKPSNGGQSVLIGLSWSRSHLGSNPCCPSDLPMPFVPRRSSFSKFNDECAEKNCRRPDRSALAALEVPRVKCQVPKASARERPVVSSRIKRGSPGTVRPTSGPKKTPNAKAPNSKNHPNLQAVDSEVRFSDRGCKNFFRICA